MRIRTLLTLTLASASLLPAQKRSLAVEEFDYSAVQSVTQAIFGTQVNIGRGISSMMVKRLQQGGQFTVVERNKVSNVLREQDFGRSGRVKQGTQARVGMIRGADLSLFGDIVVFGRDDRRTGAAVGAGTYGAGAAIGGYKNTDKAVVVIDYRLVDNESSEVLATGEARGESKRTSKGGFAGFYGGGVAGGGGFDMNSSNFAETIIGEATMDAVNHLAADLNSKGGAVSAKQVDVEAKIADVNGSTVYITAGSAQGVQVGMRFQVSRVRKEIKDPTTGEILDIAADRIGDVVITSVREKISVGNYTGSPAKTGDLVRSE